MRKEIIICDFCKREMDPRNRYAVDAKVRSITPMNPRGAARNADMCPECFDRFAKACEDAGIVKEVK